MREHSPVVQGGAKTGRGGRDVIAAKESERLRREALHDPLTGLANRTLFAERLGHALTRLGRHPHLRTLPISALKIDRSLISHMLERDEDHAVTEALIGLAHKLGLGVIAEGIETDAVLQELTELGCDEAQGYLISKPVPAAVLEGWIAQRSLGLMSGSALPA